MLSLGDLQKIGVLIGSKLEVKLEAKLTQALKPIKKSLAKIEKKLDITVRYFDGLYLDHEGRITGVESHLNLPKISPN